MKESNKYEEVEQKLKEEIESLNGEIDTLSVNDKELKIEIYKLKEKLS